MSINGSSNPMFHSASEPEETIVRTLSGARAIDKAKVTQRVHHNTKTLYHVTDSAGARAIAQTGMMLRGSGQCMFGSGIYFADSPADAASKAWHGSVSDGLITAEVDLGTCYQPQTSDRELAFRKLRRMGYDSVWARARPLGPMALLDEWIVYNTDQVRVTSIKVHGQEILPVLRVTSIKIHGQEILPVRGAPKKQRLWAAARQWIAAHPRVAIGILCSVAAVLGIFWLIRYFGREQCVGDAKTDSNVLSLYGPPCEGCADGWEGTHCQESTYNPLCTVQDTSAVGISILADRGDPCSHTVELAGSGTICYMPQGGYPMSADCTWHISCSGTVAPAFTLTQLDTEQSFDTVSLSSGGHPIAQLSGDLAPQLIDVPIGARELTVHFVSDAVELWRREQGRMVTCKTKNGLCRFGEPCRWRTIPAHLLFNDHRPTGSSWLRAAW